MRLVEASVGVSFKSITLHKTLYYELTIPHTPKPCRNNIVFPQALHLAEQRTATHEEASTTHRDYLLKND